jgi:hypothetical protein
MLAVWRWDNHPTTSELLARGQDLDLDEVIDAKDGKEESGNNWHAGHAGGLTDSARTGNPEAILSEPEPALARDCEVLEPIDLRSVEQSDHHRVPITKRGHHRSVNLARATANGFDFAEGPKSDQ